MNLPKDPIIKAFSELSQIPRCSGKEDMVLDWLRSIAKTQGHDFESDSVGNLLVHIKNGPVGKGLIIQAHVDMVCEKVDGCVHDFDRDGLKLFESEGWLGAEGTSLGADNGIAVAYMVDLMRNPPTCSLDLLFTIDEEVGLVGALKLDPKLLSGSMLINLDSEESDSLYIGCSGGAELQAHGRFETSEVRGSFLRLSLSGLQGGHSGADIHRGRANAILVLVRLLHEAFEGSGGFCLHSFEGGDKHNVIPRRADAQIFTRDPDRLKAQIERDFEIIRKELLSREPQIALNVDITTKTASVLGESDTKKILAGLRILPHGVLEIHPEMESLVGTSANIAKIRLGPQGELRIGTSQRSDRESCVRDASRKIETVFEFMGLKTDRVNGYPGWVPNLQSPLLKHAKSVYQEVFKKEPHIKAIHAGLETGVIGSHKPGLDMISFGPDIINAHSPSERAKISSVIEIGTYLRRLIGEVIHGKS